MLNPSERSATRQPAGVIRAVGALIGCAGNEDFNRLAAGCLPPGWPSAGLSRSPGHTAAGRPSSTNPKSSRFGIGSRIFHAHQHRAHVVLDKYGGLLFDIDAKKSKESNLTNAVNNKQIQSGGQEARKCIETIQLQVHYSFALMISSQLKILAKAETCLGRSGVITRPISGAYSGKVLQVGSQLKEVLVFDGARGDKS